MDRRLAPHQPERPSPPGPERSARAGTGAEHAMNGNHAGQPTDRTWPEGLEIEQPLDQIPGSTANDDGVRISLGLQSCGDVNRLADRTLHAASKASNLRSYHN